jgi:hypothetical protein
MADKWWMKLIVALWSTIGKGPEVTRMKKVFARGIREKFCYILNLLVQNSGRNAPQLQVQVWEENI